MGSATELEYLLFLSSELQYMNESTYGELDHRATEVKRMLASLLSRLRDRT